MVHRASKLAALNSSVSARSGQNIPVRLPFGNAAKAYVEQLFENDNSVFKSLYLRVVELQKKVGRPPHCQLVARTQSTPLERSPRGSVRQIWPLTFLTYTIYLTLPRLRRFLLKPWKNSFARRRRNFLTRSAVIIAGLFSPKINLSLCVVWLLSCWLRI